MPMDFPASPTNGQVFTSGGVAYTWNGYAWVGGVAGGASYVLKAGDTMTGVLAISDTTPSTSPTTGALTVAGGAGIGGGAALGGKLTVGPGDSVIGDSVSNASLNVRGPATGTTTGAYLGVTNGANTVCLIGNQSVILGGAYNSTPYFYYPTGVLQFHNDVNVKGTTASSSSTTGALTVAGGIGVAGAISIGVATSTSVPGVGNTITGINCGAVGNIAISRSGTGLSVNDNIDGNSVAFNRSGAQVGGINVTTTSTAYATSSDARLKEDLQSFDAGRIIDQTEVYDFRWKETGVRSYGIAAQQAVEVYAEPIFHDKEQDWWGVDYSKYVPVLLQELKALRARMAEMEGQLKDLKRG